MLTGAVDGTDLASLAGDVLAEFNTGLAPHFTEDSEVTGCSARYYSGSGEISAVASSSTFGSRSGFATNNDCVLLSWGISSSYRGGKPRTYLPPGGTADRASGHAWDSAYLAAVNTSAAAFLTAVDALTYSSIDSVSLGCLHFFRAGAALDPPTFDPFTTVSVQPRICSQRRRLGPEL
jgi:hypothetical protein